MSADDHAAEVDALGRRFPGWTIWFGPYTRHWWALPPRGTGSREFLEADTPQLLIARIEVVEYAAPGPPMIDDGPWPSRDPRLDARRPSNLLRLEGITPTPFRRVPAVAWPGSTAR